MTFPLRQSTASQEIPLGYFLDSEDGDSEETGLTIANTDIRIWKSGATSLVNKNSGGATHMSNGVYYAVLDATDTDTLGPLVIFIHVSGALTVKVECVVHPGNVYDALYGSDLLQVHADEMTAGLITAAVIATGAITSDELADSAGQFLADHIWKRNMATCRASSDGDGTGRMPLQAIGAIRNKKDPSGSQIVVREEDDVTEDFRFDTTTDSGADPITGLDPTT